MSSIGRNCVLAIGNFDGVHKGHAQLISRARQIAGQQGLDMVVLTFDPLPNEYFACRQAMPFRKIITLEQRQDMLRALGVERMEVQIFDARLRSMSPHQFIEQIVAHTCHAAWVVVGEDFRFGHNRQGDWQELHQLCEAQGIHTEAVSLLGEGHKFSSRDIRKALALGDLERVNQLLGYSWQLSGTVTGGHQRGRQLGFATANIDPDLPLPGLRGVFAASIAWDTHWHNAAVNLGVRPTFGGDSLSCEAHVLTDAHNAPPTLYDRQIRLALHTRLRDEQRFADPQALIAQIQQDIAKIRDWHQQHSPGFVPQLVS